MSTASAQETPPRDLTNQMMSGRIIDVVSELCNLKLSMDRHARGLVGQPFLDDWMDSRNTCAYFGDSLLRLVLPFVDWEQNEQQYFRAYVNPRHVLGASIKGLPEHVEADKVPEKIAGYAGTFGSTSNSCYIWVRPLGIFWAHEGKHRVAFMRAHDQPAIATWVREASYPAAERLAIIEPSDERDEWLVVLDGRHLQVLRRPRTSILLLQSYGVKTLHWRELSDAPDEHAVRSEIFKRRLHRNPNTTAEHERTLDLQEVRDRLNVADEIVSRSIWDLKSNRFDWRRFSMWVATPLVLGIALSQFETEWTHGTSLLMLGLSAGLSLAPSAIRFFGPNKPRANPE
ncbi:hypothetical protein LGM71_29310 [Burkholderia sp. AU33545]|uniref:hypothetical protein n=1 Tax=Burkholderia sp. AU33545 TaxID=2879631 RepID=UPI001CF11EE6|nr:hypothetical protein [Burkholderia sp. AU33545]MCA8205141.1 hypothetical protein [Burkholderia sp. AU33545]